MKNSEGSPDEGGNNVIHHDFGARVKREYEPKPDIIVDAPNLSSEGGGLLKDRTSSITRFPGVDEVPSRTGEGGILHHRIGNLAAIMKSVGFLDGKFGEKINQMDELTKKLDIIREHLTSLRSTSTTETLMQRHQTVKNMTPQEVIGAVMSSHEQLWQQHPTYYIALLDYFTSPENWKLVGKILMAEDSIN